MHISHRLYKSIMYFGDFKIWTTQYGIAQYSYPIMLTFNFPDTVKAYAQNIYTFSCFYFTSLGDIHQELPALVKNRQLPDTASVAMPTSVMTCGCVSVHVMISLSSYCGPEPTRTRPPSH